jgi:hypothetical protein
VYTFVVTLHVLSAVLIIGPFVLAAFSGHQAIKRYDVDDTRDAARWMARFGLGSLLIALLGIGAVQASDKVTFRTPWVIISLTLYVLMMALATGYTVPALRRAARILEEGVLRSPEIQPMSSSRPETRPETQVETQAGTEADTNGESAGEGGHKEAGHKEGGQTEEPLPPQISTNATELVVKERLDNIAGRIAGSGGLVLLGAVLITVMMVAKPFGN